MRSIIEKSIKNRLTSDMVGCFLFLSCFILPFLPRNTLTVSAQTEKDLLLSSFTTNYDGTNVARSHNIALACKYLNGCKIEGESSFSFNERVGARSKERGFSEAAVILDGKFVQGVGGGVCQVSTTLYNAALSAGMQITEVHAHSLRVSYVAPSLDAMVSSRSDLKFFNGAKTPVLLRARAKNGSVTVEIYGRKDGLSYRTKSVVLEVKEPPEAEVVYGDVEKVIKTGKKGIKSEAYLFVYRREKLLSAKRIRRDYYSSVRGVIQKVKEETETPTEEKR